MHNSLPAELLLHIFAYVHPCQIVRCRQISRYMRDLIDNDPWLQYAIELAIAGMEDNPTNTLSVSERRAILREHQHAWSSLTWSKQGSGTVQRALEGVWVLYDGVFAQYDEGVFHFRQFPSTIRRIQDREWTIELGADIDLENFEISPGHDLLVLVQEIVDGSSCSYHIQLRTLSTGAAYPITLPNTMWTLAGADEPDLYETEAVRVSSNYLGLLVHAPTASRRFRPPKLTIWNWKTGVRLLELSESTMHTFAFFWPRYLLIFEGYPIKETDAEDCRGIRIRVIDLDTVDSTSGSTSYLCSFLYPPLSETCSVESIELWSDPLLPPYPEMPDVPFQVAHDFAGQLWSIRLGISKGPSRREASLLSLVPASTFRSAIMSLSPGQACRDFAWEEWGPGGSRLFSAPLFTWSIPFVWVGDVNGSLYGKLYEIYDGRSIVSISDFNPLKVRRALCNPRRQPSPSLTNEPRWGLERLVTYPNNLERDSDVFACEVRTSLPYLERTSQPFHATIDDGSDRSYDALMLSEDSVMLMSTRHEVECFKLLTF